MANLMQWTNGNRDLRRAQAELEGWFNNVFSEAEGFTRGVWPKTDIYEDTEGVTLHFEVPGLDAKEVNVSVNDNTLTVSGERKLPHPEKRANYHRVENSYGAFERSFSLPQTLDTEKLNATYRNGMLQIFVPRSERAKPRSIQVKVQEK